MRPKAISLRRQPVPQMKRRFQTPIVQHDLRSISADICTVLILVVFSQTSRFGFNVRPRIFFTQNGAFGHAWRPWFFRVVSLFGVSAAHFSFSSSSFFFCYAYTFFPAGFQGRCAQRQYLTAGCIPFFSLCYRFSWKRYSDVIVKHLSTSSLIGR